MQKWNWKICVLNTFGIVMINSIRDFYLGLLKCCISLKCLHQKLMSMAMRKRWTMKIRVLRIGVTVRSLGVECTGCTNTIAQNGVVVYWVLIYHICNAMQWALHFRMGWFNAPQCMWRMVFQSAGQVRTVKSKQMRRRGDLGGFTLTLVLCNLTLNAVLSVWNIIS